MSAPTIEPGETTADAEESTSQSPWMTTKEAAVYARRHVKTISAACRLYTKGDRSSRALKNCQRETWAHRQLLRSDVDRWIRGEPPSRATCIA